MNFARKIDVLIAGAGPVGLTAALALARHGGHTIEVVDEADLRAGLSYALALHPATLAALDDLGLAQTLIAQGNAVKRVVFYDGAERKLELDLSTLDARFPFVLVLPQSQLEEVLLTALEQHGIRVRWSHRVRRIGTEPDAWVSVTVDQLERESAGYGFAKAEWVVGDSYERDVPFVIGADGHASLVRRQLGIERMPAGPAGVFATFEIAAKPELTDEMRVSLTSGTRNLWWPLPGSRSRLSFELPTEGGETSPRRKSRLPSFVPWLTRTLDDDRMRELVTARMPWLTPPRGRLMWSVAVRFERLLAERFGAGRVWLVGDAAHLAFPFGVQSMNGGIVEAAGFARRIDAVLAGKGELADLAAYGRERHATWAAQLGLGEPGEAEGTSDPWVAAHARAIVESLPATGAEAAKLLEQIGIPLSGG